MQIPIKRELVVRVDLAIYQALSFQLKRGMLKLLGFDTEDRECDVCFIIEPGDVLRISQEKPGEKLVVMLPRQQGKSTMMNAYERSVASQHAVSEALQKFHKGYHKPQKAPGVPETPKNRAPGPAAHDSEPSSHIPNRPRSLEDAQEMVREASEAPQRYPPWDARHWY